MDTELEGLKLLKYHILYLYGVVRVVPAQLTVGKDAAAHSELKP